MEVDQITVPTNRKRLLDERSGEARETKELLKALIEDLIRKSWNATRFMNEDRRMKKQTALRSLWADKQFVCFDLKKGPIFDKRDVARLHRRRMGFSG
jgi:hypothetical protein